MDDLEEPTFEQIRRGTRREYILRVMDPRGSYPRIRFRAANALYAASESVVYSVVEAGQPNEFGFSEIGWNDINEIRLWGALALSISEGQGFYRFVPQYEDSSLHGFVLCLSSLREDVVERVVGRMLAATKPARQYDIHWVPPAEASVAALYDALLKADAAVLRGVNCFLKSLFLWSMPEYGLLTEETGFDLYIALEAGLSTIRRRLSASAGRSVSYSDVFDHIAATFTYGEALADYWEEAHDDRNALLHADNDFSRHAIQPMSVDDIWELFDPMLSLYRYILIGELRPSFEEITGGVHSPE